MSQGLRDDHDGLFTVRVMDEQLIVGNANVQDYMTED
jgi:hypothetical protein